MNSAFLAFDLKAGEAGFQCEHDGGRFVHPKIDDAEEAVGLVVRETRPGGPCAPNQISCFNGWCARRATQPPLDEKLEAVLKLSASTFFVLYRASVVWCPERLR